MTSRLFMTGGSGFIGAEVVSQALARGYSVSNFDKKPPKSSVHATHWTEGDVRSLSELEQAITRFAPTHVLHLASDIDVNLSELSEFTTTIEGTKNVLSAVARLPGLQRFIHVSTQFVVRPGIAPRNEMHLEPYTVYGAAKAETERVVWSNDLGVPWVILRPTIIWGPDHPSFADHIFKHIARRTYLHPSSRAGIVRTFGYVRNVAHQMLAFLEMDAAATEKKVFYLGDGNLDYAAWADAFALELTGQAARRVPLPLLKLLGRAGDIFKLAKFEPPIDSGRVFRMSTPSAIDLSDTLALSGSPPVSFQDGVAETVAWLRTVNPRLFGASSKGLS